jgi:CTP:molybdopterin cytidylyltransferase MocA
VKVVAILLAAGSATRFGADKLLHPLLHGVPIAVQSARHLRAVFESDVLAAGGLIKAPDHARSRETVRGAADWHGR